MTTGEPPLSRGLVFWNGARRGAKLGVLVALGMATVVYPLGLAIVLTHPRERENEFGSLGRALGSVAGAFGGFCLMAFYLAIAGGIILGLLNVVRAGRNRTN